MSLKIKIIISAVINILILAVAVAICLLLGVSLKVMALIVGILTILLILFSFFIISMFLNPLITLVEEINNFKEENILKFDGLKTSSATKEYQTLINFYNQLLKEKKKNIEILNKALDGAEIAELNNLLNENSESVKLTVKLVNSIKQCESKLKQLVISENAVNQINTLEKISEIVITNYNTAISALDNIASGDINDKYSAEIKGILSVKIAELYRLFQALEDLFKGLNAAELSRVSDIFRSKNKGVFLIINDYVKQMEIIQKNIEFIGSNQVLYKTEELSNTWKILLEKLNNNFTSQREENKKLQGQLKQFIADINGVIEQINNIILDFTGKFKEQSLLTNESDTALTEFSSSIQEIAHNCEAAKTTSENSNNIAVDGKKIITQVSQEMEKINDSIKQTSNKLSELNESGRKIGNIVDIITGISEKTSLLALNAAIEAARAGESGRGFAVVADEVNKLAEQTQKSVKEISMLVDTIRVQTEMAVTSMNSAISLVQSGVNMVETASQSFGKIGESINESNNAIVEITDAVKEQEKVIDSIVGTTNKLKNINNESSVYSEKLKNTCNILKEKIVNIANIINS